MLRVAAFGEHPVVEIGGAERLVHRTPGRAVFDPVGDVGDGGMQADLAEATHAVTHSNQVAAIRQHAFLYCRIDRGVCGGDTDVALAERLIDRHRDAAARGAGRLIDIAGEVTGDHYHVVLAGASEAGAVAQAAIGVPVHQRIDLAVLAQMQQRIHDRVIEQIFADRQVGQHRDAQPLQQHRGTDAGALQNGG